MTVTAQTTSNSSTGNGVTTVFPYTFKIISSADIEVTVDGVVQTLTTHYSVSGVGDNAGGNITFVTAPANGAIVARRRNMALTRSTDYQYQGELPAAVLNPDLDAPVLMAQQLQEQVGRSLRGPAGETWDALPAAASRLDKMLAFDITTGAAEVTPFTVTQVASAVAAAYAAGSTADAVTFIQDGTGAVSRTVQARMREAFVSVKDFGAVGDGVADDTAALQAAITYAMDNNRPLFAPAGTYLITSALTVRVDTFNYASVFGPGLDLFGEGIGRTIFDSRVASGALFDIDSDSGDAHATFKGVLGVRLEGFTIKTGAAAASSTGIKLRTSYMVSLRQIHIAGLTGNGIEVVCTVGDNDAPNMVSIEQVRIDSCATWGIKADAASGFNETSFVHMRHVFIQTCGTTSASTPPPSGGMIWKGQILTLDQCGFVVCENVGLYVPGQSGLGQIVDMQTVTFENNKKRGFYSTGLSGLRGRLLQFYNNNSYTATNAFELDGSTYTVRNVEIDGAVVRATSGNNAYTAFKISGSNAVLESCRVRRVTWDNFDYAGQTRFSGWQFDHVEAGCSLIVDGATSLVLRPDATWPAKGNKMPLRLRGGAGGTPSTSGEIIDVELATSGIGISNSGLANSTRYYCYIYDNSGTPALELSTTAFATNAIGYSVKSGDATRIYVGSVETDGSAQFKTTAGGWLNPVLVPGSQVGTLHALWVDSTGDLRVKTVAGTAPTSDTDGTVVGTQT